MRHRPKNSANAPSWAANEFIGRLFVGHAATIMARMPQHAIDLVITSPPYWSAVEYAGGGNAWRSYEEYLADMQTVWSQCARVLRPNGKLCINAPILPIPKEMVKQHTRHLKNIAFDMERTILAETDLQRYALFVWQKQTSKMMFGSYPYPGNIIENNTVEFINVYVKPGKPPRFAADIKQANALTRAEWLDLTQQVWFMYPQDVRRKREHPAPFPEKLPGRLMRLYTFGAVANFPGEIVLDPFVGTGTTCAVAKMMGRRFVGIDSNERYVKMSRMRVLNAPCSPPLLLVGRPKYPGKNELKHILEGEPSTAGREAQAKHKRKNFGRSVPVKDDERRTLA